MLRLVVEQFYLSPFPEEVELKYYTPLLSVEQVSESYFPFENSGDFEAVSRSIISLIFG